MAGPSVAWDDFEIEDFLPGASFDAELLTQIRNNQEHLYEIAHAGGYGGGSAHDHTSSGASAVDLTCTENILLSSCPGYNFNNNYTAWTVSGFSTNSTKQDDIGSFIGGYTGTHTAYQVVGGNGSGESTGMIGTNGMDCVASMFVRPIVVGGSAGTIQFGFADNSTSTFTSSVSFTYTDIGEGWRRVYGVFTGAGAGHATDVRFLVRVTANWTTGVQLTGFQINRGRHLAPWTVCHMDGQNLPQSNINYSELANCPLLDQSVAINDAFEAT